MQHAFRQLPPFLLAGLLCGGFFAPPVQAQAPLPTGVEAWFWVASTRGVTYNAHILLRNHSTETLEDWTLTFRMRSPITGLTHAAWSAQDDLYTVRGRGWTYRIEPGEDVWFSFEGRFDGAVALPEACTFNGYPCTFVTDFEGTDDDDSDNDTGDDGSGDPPFTPSDIDVDFEFTSAWEGGYVARVTLTNVSGRTVDGWQVRFRMPASISILWNGILSRSEGWYVVQHAGWNRVIAPGQSRSFGFQGTYHGDLRAPTGCSFNGAACSFNREVATAADLPSQATGARDGLTLALPYPNPASSQATIHFETSVAQHVLVEAVDVLGRCRAVLFDGVAAAGVPHPVHFDRAALPGGLYLIRLRDSQSVQIVRPLVLK